MIADRPHPQTLPLLPAYLCVLGAGLATSVVFQLQAFWATGLFSNADPAFDQIVLALLGALLGAWALRLLLRGVCGFTISYWRAYEALVAGDLLGIVFVAALVAWVRHTAGSEATTALPDLFAPRLLALILSVYLVRRFATPLGYRSTAVTGELFESFEVAPRPRTPVGERDLYDEVVSAARDASLGLVELALRVPPAEAPSVITNGLPRLQLASETLEKRGCPVRELLDCHERLVRGLEQLVDDLVEAAAEAGRSASDRLLERGALAPSMGDVSDHGARYRWALSNSAGLRTVREALEELGRHGLGTTW
jgi:hypothetical protein